MASPTIKFFGVIWTKDKISVPEVKVLAFKNLPSPNTPKKASSVAWMLDAPSLTSPTGKKRKSSDS